MTKKNEKQKKRIKEICHHFNSIQEGVIIGNISMFLPLERLKTVSLDLLENQFTDIQNFLLFLKICFDLDNRIKEDYDKIFPIMIPVKIKDKDGEKQCYLFMRAQTERSYCLYELKKGDRKLMQEYAEFAEKYGMPQTE